MMNKRGGDFDYNGGGGGKRAKGGFGGKIGMRIMVPSKMAGSLIGKGGHNIQNLRTSFNCNVRIPDCPGPERILEITGEDWESVYNCLSSSIPYLYECPNGEDDGQEKELRFLIHQSAVGGIIGKGGEKIKEIRNTSGANVKVFQNPAPQSTDRCVQANGTLEKLVLAAREVYDVVQNTEIKGGEAIYDPINFDAFFASEYGGFGGGADGRKAMGGGRGGRGAPRGGPLRGGPMGMRGGTMGGPRAGFGGGFGAPGYVDDGYGGYGLGRGRGGFGAPAGPPYAPGPYGGYGEDEWGGGFGMGGNGMAATAAGTGAELEFSASEAESTQVTIPNEMAGAIIGPGGQRIRKIRNDSKATITIAEPVGGSKERVITIAGDPEAIQTAQYLLQQSVREHSSGFVGY